MTSLLLIPVCVYLGLLLIAWFFPDKVIFQPQPSSYKDGPDVIKIRTQNGETISAKFYENPGAEYTILFSHGNAEDIGDIEPIILYVRDSGFSVFAYDYRGYGTSQGTPSEKKAYEDINAAYGYLTGDLKIPPARVILHGRSLGGAVAVDLASREPVAGLILESTFITAFRVVTYIPVLPFDKFESISKLEKVSCPVLVIHGRQDGVIGFHHGEKLFSAVRGPKVSLWVDDAGHNNLFDTARESYLKTIQDFAESLSVATG